MVAVFLSTPLPVAVSVTDSQNLAIANAMKECRQAGIQVIAIDSDVDREKNRDARAAELVRVHSGASPSIMKLWPRAPVIDN